MFNFHKPRTYRSAEGCCICRAKSSSSRFTDSRKYERDTMLCFDLKYPRQGEICNACVLLVKRFKRLPLGSKRNWSHVVDARAAHGGSKIQTKYKSERASSRSTGSPTSSLPVNTTPNTGSGGSSSSTLNGVSYIPEKFNKIMKKSKKIKESSSSSSLSSCSSSPSLSLAKQRKAANNGWSQNPASLSLPTTPDSLDSDYEDSRTHYGTLAGSGAAGTVVQFQTQTRASAFRAQAAAEARRRVLKLGSRRRKCLPPRKYRLTEIREETMKFFDEEEWREQKSCCGMLYECDSLGGALIVEAANYKPCEKHQATPLAAATITQQHLTTPSSPSHESAKGNLTPLVVPSQRSIIQTLPAVVQLQTAASAAASNSVSTHSSSSTLTITKTSTPVLKKHHLFYKRQSESFPQGDMVTPSETSKNTYNNTSTPSSKTESDYNNQTYATAKQQRHNNEDAIPPPPPPTQLSTLGTAANYTISSSAALSVSVTSAAASSTAAGASASSFSLPPSPSSSSSSLYACNMPHMPKHSLAKVTTITPSLTGAHMTASTTSSMPLTKNKHNSNFLHKIKADAGKVVKHSLEKFNTAVRLKPNELLHEMKPVIKTVDKSYILAKPPTAANLSTLNVVAPPSVASTTYQTLSTYNAANGGQPLTTTTSLSAASPTSSTSSTSSTKFSDNSSDSGFDENMLDRKSASPSQEDCEKKLLSRPGVQTMFLASGVQIQGQPQNLMLTGNEVAAKLLQNRKYSSITTTNSMASNVRSLPINHPTTTAVKIAQISTGIGHHTSSAASIMSSAAQAKMRAIYNNSNTIQHENGITTIVPASSLAATTQTAAMQNIAPSTVTITPAPHAPTSGGGGATVGPAAATSVANQYSAQNIISRKLTAANIINLQSNNLSNNTTNLNSNHGVIGNHLTNSSSPANQKIILLKTSAQTTAMHHHLQQHHNQQQQKLQQQQQQPQQTSKYSQQALTVTGGGGSGNGSMMGR